MIPKCEYYPALAKDLERGAEPMEVNEFRADGRIIADRMDLMGLDQAYTIDLLDNMFKEMLQVNSYEADAEEQAKIDFEKDLLSTLDGRRWVELVPSSRNDIAEVAPPSLDYRYWLFKWLGYEDFGLILRAYLLAFPDSEVVLDVTELSEMWWETLPGPESLPSSKGPNNPVIVLTEGKSDVEFLSEALEILYPHLTDLIRFFDYGQRVAGGAGPVVTTIKAFSAAGIANRVVAVLDNDTAAADALRTLDQARLPKQIKVIQYPDIDLAREYPTLGPPTLDLPAGSTAPADINGLAASIELYLGKDVLAQEDGSLPPVQWTSYMDGMRRYQGAITNKNTIQERFRGKCSLARQNPESITEQDWEGMRLILDAIRNIGSSLR